MPLRSEPWLIEKMLTNSSWELFNAVEWQLGAEIELCELICSTWPMSMTALSLTYPATRKV
jgi:hypothetical protein